MEPSSAFFHTTHPAERSFSYLSMTPSVTKSVRCFASDFLPSTFPANRISSQNFEGAAIIREVHTYGAQVRVGDTSGDASQHAGLGRRMLEKAEGLSREAGFKRIAVIAGVGTRKLLSQMGLRT